MFTVTRKIIKFVLYALVIIIGIDFCVVNRARIDLSLFPLPYVVSTPIFIFAVAVFFTGVLFGWAIVRFKLSPFKKRYKTASARISALENELAGLRSEKLIK